MSKVYLIKASTMERIERMLAQHENMTVNGGSRVLSDQNSVLNIHKQEGGGGGGVVGIIFTTLPTLDEGIFWPETEDVKGVIQEAANGNDWEPGKKIGVRYRYRGGQYNGFFTGTRTVFVFELFPSKNLSPVDSNPLEFDVEVGEELYRAIGYQTRAF